MLQLPEGVGMSTENMSKRADSQDCIVVPIVSTLISQNVVLGLRILFESISPFKEELLSFRVGECVHESEKLKATEPGA